MVINSHKKSEKDLHEALDSYNYVFCGDMQADGKTYTAVKEVMNNYSRAVFIGDTHLLNDEINIELIKNNSIVPEERPNIINFFGADYDNISPAMQKAHGYPPCLCPYCNDPNYYLKKLNYFPKDWCLDKCPYSDTCAHKEMIIYAISSLKFPDVQTIWLMVKAYLDTNMLDEFLKTKNHIGIIDENILGLCFEQISLHAVSIRKFNSLADIISSRHRSLREIYVALRDIFKLIDNYITYEKDTDIRIKAKKITEKIKEFLNSYELEDIEEWNKKFKALSLKSPGTVKKIYNIMNMIIKMFQNCKEKGREFEAYLVTDPENPIITLFVSKVEQIRKTVHRFHKLIFTDALLPTVITEITKLLQLEDKYKFLYDASKKAKWKEVKVYKLNNKYGAYPKNTLLTLLKDNVSESFFKLIELSKHIIQFEAERDRNIGLIGSMKIFQHNRFGTTIQKELIPTIEKYNMDVSFQYYKAAPGENTYDNINWVIEIGSFNVPHRDRTIQSNILGINMDKLEWLFGVGTLIQFAHRGRPLQRPNEVSAYFLTNEIKGWFEQEENFRNIPTILHSSLIKIISENRGITTDEIIAQIKAPKSSIVNILSYLIKEGLIKNTTFPSRRGRPSLLWSLV